MGVLGSTLRAVRERGAKAFVPYVTGGFEGVDPDLLRALQASGADAVEVGIPHSDPIMDGGVIQEASRLALERGVHPSDIMATIEKLHDLKSKGALTEDEFNRKKAELLAKLH